MDPLIVGVGSSAGWAEGDMASLAHSLEEVQKASGGCVELYASALSVVGAGRLIPHRVAELRKIITGSDLTPTIHAPIPINFMDRADADLHWRAARASLELAGEIAAPAVVFHAGRCHPREWARDEPGLLAYEREVLERVGELASQHNTRAALENISPNRNVILGAEWSYSLIPAKLAEQLAQVESSGVTGCLDIAHARQGATLTGTDFLAGIEAMGPECGHIHISDVTGEPSPLWIDSAIDRVFFGVGDTHAPLGWAGIDFDLVAEVFRPQAGTLAVLELAGPVRCALAESIVRLKAFAERVG